MVGQEGHSEGHTQKTRSDRLLVHTTGCSINNVGQRAQAQLFFSAQIPLHTEARNATHIRLLYQLPLLWLLTSLCSLLVAGVKLCVDSASVLFAVAFFPFGSLVQSIVRRAALVGDAV